MNIQRVCVIILCLATTAPAQEALFTGGVSNPGDWNVPGNWNTGAVPDSATNAIVGDDLFQTNAVAEITGDLTEPVIADLRVAAGFGSLGNVSGTINQSAGSLTTDSEKWAFVGGDGPTGFPNTGTYNLSGTASFGTSTVGTGAEFHIGIGGGADAGNQGFVSVSGEATLDLNRVYVGSNDDNFGTLTQTGGSIFVNDWLSIGRETGATGVYNMSGGTLTITNDFLTVGENTGASGTFNVSGDAQISTSNLAVARFGGAATGLMTITGGDASIDAGSFRVGRNDQNDNLPEDVVGTLSFTSDGNVSPINVTGDVYLNDGSVLGTSTLEVDLTGSSVTGNVLLISVGGTLDGTFANLGEGDMVPNSGGRTLTYMGGDGNDVVLLGESTVDGDFNMDGMWDCDDIDALVAAIASGSTDLSFDMNGDMMLSPGDVTDASVGWLAVGGANNTDETDGNPFLVGDANLDGFVDGLDFIEWNMHKFTTLAAWCSGDFNADGFVDGLDFIEWNANKFTSSTGNAAAVPEPGLGLCWLVGLLLVARRRTS